MVGLLLAVSVGLPSALETEAIQRRPVHWLRHSLRRVREIGRRLRLGPELDQAGLAAHLVHMVHQVVDQPRLALSNT